MEFDRELISNGNSMETTLSFYRKGRARQVDRQLVWECWEQDRDRSIKDFALVLDYSKSSVQRALAEYLPYQQAKKRLAPL